MPSCVIEPPGQRKPSRLIHTWRGHYTAGRCVMWKARHADVHGLLAIRPDCHVVFRACRAILRDPHAAEDALQATFLVLARKAGGLWVRGSLGPWLLSVARRVAYCARTDASRQRAHERTAAERAAPATVDPGWDDRDAILHEELVRLPEKYRTAVVLCDLEGLTHEQAARQLGWHDGTVRSRLARVRERLRERLTRRGMAPAVDLAGQRPLIDLTSVALVQSTVQGPLRHVPGQALGSMAAAEVIPAAVATLAEKGVRTIPGRGRGRSGEGTASRREQIGIRRPRRGLPHQRRPPARHHRSASFRGSLGDRSACTGEMEAFFDDGRRFVEIVTPAVGYHAMARRYRQAARYP
jgi:RNA polymerase sigma factor (sigma-70 family)